MYSCEFNFSWPGSHSKTPSAPVPSWPALLPVLGLTSCQQPSHCPFFHTESSSTSCWGKKQVMILKAMAKAWKKPSFTIPKKPTYLEHPTYIIRELVVQTLWKTGQIIYGVAWCVPLSKSQHMCIKSILYLGFHLVYPSNLIHHAAANTANKSKNPPKLERLI